MLDGLPCCSTVPSLTGCVAVYVSTCMYAPAHNTEMKTKRSKGMSKHQALRGVRVIFSDSTNPCLLVVTICVPRSGHNRAQQNIKRLNAVICCIRRLSGNNVTSALLFRGTAVAFAPNSILQTQPKSLNASTGGAIQSHYAPPQQQQQ